MPEKIVLIHEIYSHQQNTKVTKIVKTRSFLVKEYENRMRIITAAHV